MWNRRERKEIRIDSESESERNRKEKRNEGKKRGSEDIKRRVSLSSFTLDGEPAIRSFSFSFFLFLIFLWVWTLTSALSPTIIETIIEITRIDI